MKNKIFKSLLIFVVIVVAILFLIPGIAKRYTIKNSKELIGRQINIEDLKYNYFTSTLKIYDFNMLEQNEQNNFVSFDTLIVNLEPLQLLKDKIEIEKIFLKGLNVNVIMKDSLFNFEDLIAFYSSSEDTINNKVEESTSYKYSLSNLELKNADIHFNNKDLEDITSIENISFMVPFISWDQEEKSNADMKFNFPNGGYFESAININPIDGEFDADLIISDLYLDSFYKYVAEYSKINSFKGILNTKINLVGNTNEIDKTIASGGINITDFSMTDNNDKTFLSTKKLGVSIQNLDYFNNSYIIDSLNIIEPYTFFKLDSITNNLSTIFKLNEPVEISEIDTKMASPDSIVIDEPKLYYAINHLKIANGVLDYTDNLTGNPFDYHLSAIKVNSDSIFSDSKRVNIYSDMLLNNRGTLKAKVGFEPENTMNADLDISIEKFLLSDINVYSNHYTGHNILKGDIFYYSKSTITNGDLVSENKLMVKNVSLNKTERGLYSLPLKFALFLLKDKNGDINLDIPVKGDVNDPTVNVGKIAWNTFKNLIIKTAASPGKLLAGLVNGDPKEIEEITFSYLDSTLTNKNLRQLDKLLEIENKKEEVKIEMVYYVDTKLQKEAIAKNELGKLYYEETQKDYLKDVKGFEEFLLSKAAIDSLNIDKSYLAIANKTKVDSIAENNSKAIIYNIKKYLHSANDSTQINVRYSDLKDPLNVGAKSMFKVNFSLKEDEF